MATNMSLTDTDQETVQTNISLGSTKAGVVLQKKLGIKNNRTDVSMQNVTVKPFANVKNKSVSLPISRFNIIRRNNAQELQITSVAKEHADAVCTQRTSREKFYLFDGASTYTAYDTNDAYFMSSATDIVYIMSNEIYFNLYFEFSTPGSYTDLTYEIWNGSAYESLPVDYVDGTSGLTTNGNLFLGAVENVIAKNTINKLKMYVLKISCSAVTTQAIASTLYWNYVYDTSKHFISNNPTAYYKKNGGYTPISAPEKIYANLGRLAFKTDPVSIDDLAIAYAYKNPQSGEFIYTFHRADTVEWTPSTEFLINDLVEPVTLNEYYYECSTQGTTDVTEPTWSTTVDATILDGSAVWTCKQGSGSPLYCQVNRENSTPIVCDGYTKDYDSLYGCELVFSSSADITDVVTVDISNDLKYLWLAEDSGGSPSTYANCDIDIGDIASGTVSPFWVKVEPHIGETGADNIRYISMYAVET